MENKTAVEWLIEELDSLNKTQVEWHNAIKQALALEQKQIEDAYKNGKKDMISQLNSKPKEKKERASISFIDKKIKTAEQYYSQTFKTKGNE